MDAPTVIFGVLAIGAGLFATAAYGVISVGDFRAARRWFLGTACCVGLIGIELGLMTAWPLWIRAIVAGLFLAAAGVGFVFVAEWTRLREAAVGSEKLPDVTLRFVYPEHPALMLINQSDVVAKQIKWTVLLWNLSNPRHYSGGEQAPDSHEPLQIPVQTFDFLRGGTISTQNLLDSPLVTPHRKDGDLLFGSASAVCAECDRGHTFIVEFVLGRGGWFAELPDQKGGGALFPNRLTRDNVLRFREVMLAKIPESARVPITNPF